MRLDDLVAAMVEEYGGTSQFSEPTCRFAAESFLNAAKALEQIEFSKTIGKATVTLEPLGVAGLITPWNGSSAFVCWKLAYALAAGCTAVLKPSELSALQTEVLLECLHEARLPIEIANDTTYGLYGYVSGTDVERTSRIASRIVAGRVMINGFHDEPLAPFGGFKQSGVGREWGTYGIEAYLEPKSVMR